MPRAPAPAGGPTGALTRSTAALDYLAPTYRAGPCRWLTPKMKRRKKLLLVLSAAGVAVVLAAFGITMLLMSGEKTSGAPPAASGCSSDTSAIALDPAKVPEPGTALRDTLTSAIARYFRCSSVPFDQLARTFATISVIVPHYVTDEKCFQGESKIVRASWADHKGWADRQAREEPLRISLHRTIENALACLRPAEQRLFFTDVARASAYVTSRFASQTFVDPSLKGQRVDRCLYPRARVQRAGSARLVPAARLCADDTMGVGLCLSDLYAGRPQDLPGAGMRRLFDDRVRALDRPTAIAAPPI